MYKIAVIGKEENIYGFRAIGFSAFPASSTENVREAIHSLAKKGYAIIYITEDAALLAKDCIEEYKDLPLPAIIPIPGSGEGAGYGMEEVANSVKRAVGADIIK